MSTICQNQERKEEKRKTTNQSNNKSINCKSVLNNNTDGSKIPKNKLKDFVDMFFVPNYEKMGSVDLYY